MARVLVGIVGYYQFIRGYPLGPELMARLRQRLHEVEIREMNWGPIAIVQDFQASGAAYDRVVLVGAVDRGAPPGAVSVRRWMGGTADPLAVQLRVFEAVTGVISLDNLLVIGSHFGVWPAELITVEVQFPESNLSDFVLAEIEMDRAAGEMAVIGEQPLSPDNEAIVERIADLAHLAARDGIHAWPEVAPLSLGDLAPVAAVCHHRFAQRDGAVSRESDRNTAQ